MNQYRIFVQTSTLSPNLHHKLTEDGKCWKHNNNIITKTLSTFVSVILVMLRYWSRNWVVDPLMMRVNNTTPPVRNTNWCIWHMQVLFRTTFPFLRKIHTRHNICQDYPCVNSFQRLLPILILWMLGLILELLMDSDTTKEKIIEYNIQIYIYIYSIFPCRACFEI